jgi:hypothetical protein
MTSVISVFTMVHPGPSVNRVADRSASMTRGPFRRPDIRQAAVPLL